MISFFRKIRKKMAKDNRPLQYLRYAIGEIFLVVIGILIAVQINNWNEGQKKSKLKQTYVDNLINDLTKDTVQINAGLKENYLLQKNADSLIVFINQPGTGPNELAFWAINHGIPGLRTMNTYNTNTFNLLISSGNIDLFSNSLTNQLMELNRLQNYEISVSNGNRASYFDIANKYREKFLANNSIENKELIEFALENVNLAEHTPLFINMTNIRKHSVERYISITEEVKTKTEQLLDILKIDQNQ